MPAFLELAELVQAWPAQEAPEPGTFDDPFQRRLVRALSNIATAPERVGPGDLAGLCRQVLRRESLRLESSVLMDVPTAAPWPTRTQWEEHGVDVALELGTRFRISAGPWSPSWLDDDAVDNHAMAGEPRNISQYERQADPSVRDDLGIERYRSPGQAGALRAVALLPRGQTLVCGLPTGSGKSLLFQSAAVQAARNGEITVVVLPTTALAIDQERRMKDIFRRVAPSQAAFRIAYHSGLSSDEKLALRQRLVQGEQSVVVASPEAIVGSLRATLDRVAADGRLGWFAIDEAHMVSQWGDSFRPEFQLLAASVANWRRSNPEHALRTLLLSATLAEESLTTLQALFAPRRLPGETESPFHLLIAPELRPEPDYWVATAPNEPSRLQMVTEAVRHLPRPAIIYTARRPDAESIAAHLRAELGVRRISLFRGGDVSTSEGTLALERWNSGEIDVVVATSAFGLGMDNGEVRTVIHACIPETVDRFYQEVGRGGRDGNACVSLMVHTPSDRDVARKLAEKRLIGLDRGWERWSVLRVGAVRVDDGDDSWRVRLDDKPRDLIEENDANRAWNVRTLILMTRAGLIDLRHPRLELPELREGDSETEHEHRIQEALDVAYGHAVVVENTPITEKSWRTAVASIRAEARERDKEDGDRIAAILEKRLAFNEIFASTYTVQIDDRRISPPPFPGQCPVTRDRQGDISFLHQPGQVCFSSALLAELGPGDRNPTPPSHHWVTYAAPPAGRRRRRTWASELNRFLEHAAAKWGIVELCLPNEWRQDLDMGRVLKASPNRCVVLRNPDEFDPINADGEPSELPLPRITALAPDTTDGRLAERLQELRRPFHMILVPTELRDPSRPDRPFVATRRPHDRLEHLLEREEL